MDQEKYTDRVRGFLQSAQMLALRSGHQRFNPEHVLKVLLDDEEGLAANLIAGAGGDSRLALRETEQALAKLPKVEGSGAGQVYLAPETARSFEQAEQLAKKANDSFVTVERLQRCRYPQARRRHAQRAQRVDQQAAQGPHRRQRRSRELV